METHSRRKIQERLAVKSSHPIYVVGAEIANKYTDLRELTPEVLRTFIERIIIHERTAKHSKTATQQIDIYFRYIGKLAPEGVA